MKQGFELSEEDFAIADRIDSAVINKEMLPYFIFYYRKLHPELESFDDLYEAIEILLLEDVKYIRIDSWTSREDGLYNGYKNYPRAYCLFLCGTIYYSSEKIKRICIDIRKYIRDNEGDELASDIVKILDEESIIKCQVHKIEFEPINAFLINHNWSGVNLYTESSSGKVVNKLWKTKWRKYIEHLLSKDVVKHISDTDIRNEVEQFLNEKKSVKSKENIKTEENTEKENNDISNDEFIENIFGENYKELLENEKERAESLLKKRDDLIEKILNLPDINHKIFLLIYIGTNKSLCFAWDIIINKSETYEHYKFTLDNYMENFPLKLLRKEISKLNIFCIKGIAESENEKAIRFLFAILWNGIIQNKNKSLLEIKNAISPNDIYGVSNSYFTFGSGIPPKYLYRLYISSIFHSKEKESIETSDDLWNITYLESNYDECLFDIIYEMLAKNNILSENLKSFISYSFYHNTLKDYYNQCCDGMYEQDYSYAYLIYSVLISWSKNKEIKLELIDKYQSNMEEYEDFYLLHIRARIILNANFIVPKYSEENEKKAKQLLYPRTTFYELKAEKAKKENVSIPMINNNLLWNEFWRDVIIKEQLKIYNKYPIKSHTISLPTEPEYEEYILSRSDDIFSSGIDTLMVHEFKEFLFEFRKKNIKYLKKENILNEEEIKKLLELIKKANYYGLSDNEIKSCLSEEKNEEQWKTMHTRLEAEFMGHVFEKCLLWVIKFDKSELWEEAPWWGMKIFSKSFIDRPRVWATHLLEALNKNLEEFELLRVCFAIGALREPLGGAVPKELKRIADEQTSNSVKEKIIRQHKLFQRQNLKRGKHTGNEKKRVEKCRKELLRISEIRFSKV